MLNNSHMTGQEIAEACAKMMGWKKENNLYKKDGRWWQPDTGGGYVIRTSEDFRPLIDWNDTMEVAERAMERGGLDMRFVDPWLSDDPQRAICLEALKIPFRKTTMPADLQTWERVLKLSMFFYALCLGFMMQIVYLNSSHPVLLTIIVSVVDYSLLKFFCGLLRPIHHSLSLKTSQRV